MGRTPVADAVMLPRQLRLTRKADFDAVFTKGERGQSRHVMVRCLATGAAVTRYGFAVSKAVGNAVVRNRVKRRLREIVRQAHALQGWDVAVVARPSAAAASYPALRDDLHAALRRTGLFDSDTKRSSAGARPAGEQGEAP